jgi:hypothetical protein
MTDMDTTRCPICGSQNECAMAADPGASDCWCFAAQVSDEALKAIPEEARGLVCICARCAAGAPPERSSIHGLS